MKKSKKVKKSLKTSKSFAEKQRKTSLTRSKLPKKIRSSVLQIEISKY